MYPITLLARFTRISGTSGDYGIDPEKFRGLCFLYRDYEASRDSAGIHYPMRMDRVYSPFTIDEYCYSYTVLKDMYEVLK